MRAPPDSMKPTTGAPARPASRSTRTIESACCSPSEPPEVGRVLRVAEHRAAVDAARRRRSRRRRRARASAHPARAHVGAEQRQRARVAQRLEALDRRELLVGVRGRARSSCGLQARARRCGRRSRTRSTCAIAALAVDLQRAGLARARSPGRGPPRAPRARASAARCGRAARAAWPPPRPRRRRRADGRSPTWWTTRGSSCACVAEHGLERQGLGAVVERGRGAVRVDVDDVLAARGPRRRAPTASPRPRPRPSLSGAVRW